MAYIFGDGFDLYSTMADPIVGYWDSGLGVAAANVLAAGRFAGSQAVSILGTSTVNLVKSSSVNDAVHHIVCAFRQTAALSGTSLGLYFQLTDVSTNQCCIVFRSDGAILLTSATPAGTVLATYTGAVTAANAWFAFEFEVVINNTTGSFTVRTNGATSNSFSATGLNTRPGTNAYANKLTVGMNTGVNAQQIDDLLWRSDASSVAWMGDVRCYTKMPASDASVQFSRSPTTITSTVTTTGTTANVFNTTARYSAFTAAYTGTISTITVTLQAGYTGNMKCTMFASSGTGPTTILGSATTITNPATGTNTFTFGTPISVTAGTQYWLGFMSDTTSGAWNASTTSTAIGATFTTTYAAFPTASPAVTTPTANLGVTVTITLTANYDLVNEPQQDGTTTYVYDSTVGHADFYSFNALGATPPAAIIALTTRGFVEKSDAGSRSGAMQLKSGATTVASTTTVLGTSFGWLYRTDTVDPNTSTAWTTTTSDAAQIGPTVIA